MDSAMHTNRKQNRYKPLLTCAVSISEIASKAYKKTQDFDTPIGPTAKKLSTFATYIFPFLCLFQYFLAILSFLDDRILFFEKIIQTLFPPSAKIFDKVDYYAHIIEKLPSKFDDVFDKFPMIIHRVPFLDWALGYMISWLKFFLSILTGFGSSTSREKEIVVDKSEINHSSPVDISVSSNYSTKNETQNEIPNELVPEIVPCRGEKKVTVPIISEITKCSYKEVLEKGKIDEGEKKKDNVANDKYEVSEGNKKSDETNVENENENSEENGNDDSLLDLFAASWHMKPSKKAEKGSILRSASYT